MRKWKRLVGIFMVIGLFFVPLIEVRAQTDLATRAEALEYAVDFAELPSEMTFRNRFGEPITISTRETEEGPEITFYSQDFYYDFLYNLGSESFSGYSKDGSATNLSVYSQDDSGIRDIQANTQVQIQLSSPHQTDFMFYFYYNREGGLSLVFWDGENHQTVLEEFVWFLGDTEAETSQVSYSEKLATLDWMPVNWHQKAARKPASQPDVTWLLMSSLSAEENLIVEPVFLEEKAISGYSGMHTPIVITWNSKQNGKVKADYSEIVVTDDKGYFQLNLEGLTYNSNITALILGMDEGVPLENIPIYPYQPTALEDDSGYLLVERFYEGQDYVAGYTYPYASLEFKVFDGSAGVSTTNQADADGYFYSEVAVPQGAHASVSVSTLHPDTGQEIVITPYPWSEAELENPYW